LNELRAFLDEYGHREAGGTMLLSQETWRDAPQVVLGMLKGMAMRTARAHAGNQQFEDARQKASRGFLMHLPGARSLFGKVLQQARSFVQVREDTRFYATLVMPVLRRTLLEMGRRLEEQGVLDEAADVFHLRMEELEAAARAWPPDAAYSQSLAQLVRRRKEKRATLQETPLIDPRLYRRQAPRAQKTRRGALLQGTPGSPGVVVGPVCVVHDGAEFGKLRAGDVLVAPYTNPAWTPLFQTAAAVVVDTGSAASHAAITAREYGIPAVMATVDGTGQLWDGQMVKVDGGQGVVRRAT
jgi:pyruvate,water dikinase